MILFVLNVGSAPFGQATSADEWYRFIYAQDFDTFWAAWEQNLLPNNIALSAELADLITRLIAGQPELRISFSDVVCHPWLDCKRVASAGEAHAELAERTRKIVKERNEVRKVQQKPP